MTLLIALFALVLIAPIFASFTHTISNSWNDGQNTISGSGSQTSEQEHNTDTTVPASTNNHPVDVAFNFADLKSLFILSTQDMLLETNNSTTPDDTISLKANIPYTWQSNGYGANPFDANVTRFFFTNATATAATLQIRMLLDPTP
jgi:hypothetical protein